MTPDDHPRERDERARSLAAGLAEGVAVGQLWLAYQPLVDLRTGRAHGLEALARWDHPRFGPVPPSEFVAAAEAAGTDDLLASWAVEQACRQAAAWRAAGGPAADLRVSVNVPARQVSDGTLPGLVAAALAAHRLDGTALCVEMTETAPVDDVDTAAGTIAALRRMGVAVSLDDFGTGHSSLAYLGRFRVDQVKLDRAFVAGLDEQAGRTVVAGVVALCDALGVATLAEGVETAEQAAVLAELGCRSAQGWLFARAVPAAEVPAVLAGPLSDARTAA